MKKNFKEKIIGLIMAAVIGAASFTYMTNYGNGSQIAVFSALALIPALILAFLSGKLNDPIGLALQRLVRLLGIKPEYNVSAPKLAAFFIILVYTIDAVFMAGLSTEQPGGLGVFAGFMAGSGIKIARVILFYSVFFLILSALGQRIAKLFRLDLGSAPEASLFGLSVGLIPVSLATFGLLALGLFSQPVVWLLAAMSAWIAKSEIKKTAKLVMAYRGRIGFKTPSEISAAVILAMVTVLLGFQFIANFKPHPITTDDLSAYFNAPWLYSQYRSYRPLMHHEVANMGQNTEMAYTAILSGWGSEYLAHFEFFFFLLAGSVVYLMAKKILGLDQAVWSLLFFVFIPWNSYYAGTAKVEMLLTFYMAMLSLAIYRCLTERNGRYLLLGGALAGFAVGIKYFALFLVVPIWALVIFSSLRKGLPGLSIRACALSVALAAAVFLPWAVKNQYYFRNPLYPFPFPWATKAQNAMDYDRVFAAGRDQEIKALRHGTVTGRDPITGFMSTVINQSVGRNIDPGAWINFGFLPLLLSPFLFAHYRDRRILAAGACLMASTIIWYAFNSARPWYMFPSIALLSAALPTVLWRHKSLLFASAFFAAAISASNMVVIKNNISYLAGKLDDGGYSESMIPYWRVAGFINNTNLDSGKILILKDMRTAFIENNDELVFVDQYLKKIGFPLSQGMEKTDQFLAANDIRYILDYTPFKNHLSALLNGRGISVEDYLRDYGQGAESVYVTMQKLEEWLDERATPIFSDNGYTLYEAKTASE